MNQQIHEKKALEYAQYQASQVPMVKDTMAITFVTLAEQDIIDDVTASEHSELFFEWEPNIDYDLKKKKKIICRREDKLYKCLQTHRSQFGWEPENTPSLWKAIGDPTVEYPDWSQPVGAGDGYEYGAKVSHVNKHWHSEYQGENIWEPGAIGTEALWIVDL